MNEFWKEIKGYEGSYQISNKGRVKSLDRVVNGRKLKGKILSANGNRYLKVILYKNNIGKNKDVHRLVAIHFVDGYFNNAVVNHKDGDKLNNLFTNLEWCTSEHNNLHAKETGLLKPPTSFEHGNSIDILNLDTGVFYGSLREAGYTIGINKCTLSDRINGRSKITTSFIQLK